MQTISFLCYLKETCGITGPSLVVCPLSVLSSWCKEIPKWAPTLKFHRLHSPDATEQENQRKILAERGSDYDVILTTYEMIKAPQLSRAWSRLHFNMLVLDEGHRIKNHESQISIAMRKIHCENRLILTGSKCASFSGEDLGVWKERSNTFSLLVGWDRYNGQLLKFVSFLLPCSSAAE